MGQRPRELSPETSPQHFWGAEVRTRRNGLRMSLAELGRRVHCDPSYLAKIERAERLAPPHLAADLDRVLDADGVLVRLHALTDTTAPDSAGSSSPTLPDAGWRRLPSHVASPPGHVANEPVHVGTEPSARAPLEEKGGEVVVPVRSDGGRIIYVSVDRRRFLQGLGAGLGVAALTASSNSYAQGASPVEHFRQLRRTLADSDNLFGPARVIPTVHEQINLMQQIRRTQRGADLKELLCVQSEFADLLGWLHQDCGDHQAAQFWLDRALEWSYAACDPEATIFIMARKSQLAGDMGDGIEAVGVAEAAISMARPGSRMAAIAATYAAHGHALGGDDAAVLRSYDQARELLASAEQDQCPWGQFFDEALSLPKMPPVLVRPHDRTRAGSRRDDHTVARPGQRSGPDR